MAHVRSASALFVFVTIAGALTAACSGGSSDPAGNASSGSGGSSGGATGTGSGGAATGVGGAGGAATGAGGAVTGAGGTLTAAGGNGGNGGSTGGSAGAGGTSGAGGTGGTSNPDSELGNGVQMGSGSSDEQYYTADDITRDGQEYVLITNGWGPGFQSQSISWLGTSFTVESMSGTAGDGGQPATYPTVFCGRYSVQQVPDCGLPAAISSLTSLRTGWRWAPNGNTNGEYNAAYDIWLGSETQFQSYMMVWLRDPPSYQPAGQLLSEHVGITVQNVPGTWNIWQGTVNGRPIINWVRNAGSDSYEIEFDVLDFLADAEQRGLSVPGTHVRAVAVGFEIWEGPITNLQSLDFYVHVN